MRPPTTAERVAEFYVRLAQANPQREPRELALIGNALIVKARYIQLQAGKKTISTKQRQGMNKDYAWMDRIGHELGISTLANTKPDVLVVYFMSTLEHDAVRYDVPL